MWQAENPELAREFPAGTASKARQSRLHQAQGVFPFFVFHSFVQFLNISRVSCSKTNEWLFNESNSWTLMFQKGVKKGTLPARNVSPLMSIHCFINFWTIREQFVFNSCSRKQFVFQTKSIRAPQKWKPPWWTHSWTFLERKEERARQKNQQFWAFFRRFDINIFNLREHFPLPNFTFSARSFSLPSSNLN